MYNTVFSPGMSIATDNNKENSQSPNNSIPCEYYRHLCNCSSFAIISADCRGRIVTWNQAAEKLFNTRPSDVLGRHLEIIVPEGVRLTLRESIEQALTNRQTGEFELKHRDEHGELMTLAVVIAPIVDNSDQILGIAAWIRDITNRKQLERYLAQAEKMASLGTLASGVAHHFNNIVGGVATFVDYALSSQDPQSTKRALEMTAEAADRISKITSSLLTFAEKDMRQFDLSDLTEVILSFSHLVEKPLREKNIKLDLHLQAVPVYEVPGSRIHQILGHLLDNAERSMAEGGTVTIDLQRSNNNLILKFSDTGCGIAPNILPHVFEPFFTTNGTISGGNYSCSGLGLAVVHGIVNELGGTINVESQPDNGTTFTICFPLSKINSE